MTYDPSDEEIQKAIADSEEEGRRWRASATSEQLAAMAVSTDRMEEYLLAVFALKLSPGQFKALADTNGVTDGMLARAYERMKAPPMEDQEFKAAAGVLGGLP